MPVVVTIHQLGQIGRQSRSNPLITASTQGGSGSLKFSRIVASGALGRCFNQTGANQQINRHILPGVDPFG